MGSVLPGYRQVGCHACPPLTFPDNIRPVPSQTLGKEYSE